MTREALEDLARLTAVIRDAEAARMRRLTDEEARIRADLAALDADRRDAGALPAAALAVPRSVGADMLWQAWMGRARKDLQMRLARVLARKGAALRGLQIAHGRCEAARGLRDRARTEHARRRAGSQAALEQSLFPLTSGKAGAHSCGCPKRRD